MGPGVGRASIDALVERVLTQIERFAKELPGGEAQVEVELRDGSVIPLESILAEPATASSRSGRTRRRKEEVVVPVGAIARLQLGPPEQHPPFGFSKPAAA